MKMKRIVAAVLGAAAAMAAGAVTATSAQAQYHGGRYG